jgi:hypothetical protein
LGCLFKRLRFCDDFVKNVFGYILGDVFHKLIWSHCNLNLKHVLQMSEMAEAPHPAMNLPTMMIQTAEAPAITTQPIRQMTSDTRRLFFLPTMSMNLPEVGNEQMFAERGAQKGRI